MRIERRGVVGLLEVQTSGGTRNVVDVHDLTGKFYEQTNAWFAGSAPPALRDASQLFKKEGYLINTFMFIRNKSHLNTTLNVSRQSRPILDYAKHGN
jgi:hypothetical protein